MALFWTRGIPEQLVEGSWARQERKMEIDLEAKEEVSERREGNFVKRYIASVSTEVFCHFRQGEELESCGNSWSDLWDDLGGFSDGDLGIGRGVPDVLAVTAVLVSLSSAVIEVGKCVHEF